MTVPRSWSEIIGRPASRDNSAAGCRDARNRVGAFVEGRFRGEPGAVVSTGMPGVEEMSGAESVAATGTAMSALGSGDRLAGVTGLRRTFGTGTPRTAAAAS